MLASAGCGELQRGGPSLAKATSPALPVGSRVPDVPELNAAGPARPPIARRSPAFSALVRCAGEHLVFKDEEKTGADTLMIAPLCSALMRLGNAVQRRWPSMKLRVTEAWDEQREHGARSFHYEGRAADLTTSDLDRGKLGELAALAVTEEFDWVFFEDQTHVHVSVRAASAVSPGR